MNTINSNIMLATDIQNLEKTQSTNLITMTLTALRINFSSKRKSSSTLSAPVSDVKSLNILPEITLQEVANHDTIDDCWIVLYDRVYDVTKFLDKHPGGEDIILEYGGRDATIAFRGTGHSKLALNQLREYLIGELPSHERIYRNSADSAHGGGGSFLFQLSDIPD